MPHARALATLAPLAAAISVVVCPAWSEPAGAIVPPAPTCAGVPATLVGTAAGDVLIGTDGVDVIVGLGGDDQIWGHGGNDIICAGAGNDLLAGEAGADRLYGQRGRDLAGYGNAPGPIRANLAQGSVIVVDGRDRVDSIEDLVGSTFDDRMIGNERDNTLIGHLGVDRVYGAAGNDTCVAEYEWTCEID